MIELTGSGTSISQNKSATMLNLPVKIKGSREVLPLLLGDHHKIDNHLNSLWIRILIIRKSIRKSEDRTR